MTIEKETGSPYYTATHNGHQYLGYSHQEAMSRALNDKHNAVPFKIWCLQRGCYFADGAEFQTLGECKEQLISYHSQDCEEESLQKMTLLELLDFGEWEVHNRNGEVV